MRCTICGQGPCGCNAPEHAGRRHHPGDCRWRQLRAWLADFEASARELRQELAELDRAERKRQPGA